MNSRILKLAGLVALTACTTSPPSLVMVHVNAETGIQLASRSYVVHVEGRAPGGAFVEEHLETYQGWGRDFTLGPREHDASRSYRVTLIAFQGPNGDGDEVARNVLISGYVQSQTRQYDLILYDACQGVECGENELCDIAGNCRPAEIPPTNLPLFDAGTGEDGGVLPDTPGTDAQDTDGAVTDAGMVDVFVIPDGAPSVDGGSGDDASLDADAGLEDASPEDTGPSDAASDAIEPTDAMELMDARPPITDAMTSVDAGPPTTDAMTSVDAGPIDAGPIDAGLTDAGVSMDGVGFEDVGGIMDTGGLMDVAPPRDIAMPDCPSEGEPCGAWACATSGIITCSSGMDVCTPVEFVDPGTTCGGPTMPDRCPTVCDGANPDCPSLGALCAGPQVCCPDGSCAASC